MKKTTILSIIILLFSVFLNPSIVVAEAIASPQDTNINFIKNVSITDGSGKNLAGSTVSESTKVQFNMDFEVPNSYTVVPGEKYIMNIDNIIKYRTGVKPIDLKFNGVSMGTVDIINGQAIITFDDSVKTLTNIKGEFSFWSNFDKSQIDYENGNDISLPTSDNPDNKIHLKFSKDSSGGSSGESLISKSLTYDKEDPTIIDWSITVNNVGNAVNNSIFVDRMDPGMEYIAGSTVIKYRNYKGSSEVLKVDNSDLNFIKQGDGSTQVTVNFGELTSKASQDPNAVTSILITYKSRIIDNGVLGRYANHAISFDGNDELAKANSTASWRGQDGGGSGDNNAKDLKGKKIWKDNDNANQLRPDHVVIHLLRNGEQFLTRSALASDDWNYDFTNLAIMDPDGNPYKYEVKEEGIPNYTSKIIETDDGFNIENSLNNDIKTSIVGTKSWEDDNNSEYMRPSSIVINLLQNGNKIDSKVVSADTNWQYKFNNLSLNDKDGEKYEYTVSEDRVPNYLSDVNGYDVTNTFNPDISISGNKTWVDENNAKKTRPASITINLLANGKQVESKKVSAAEDWKYKFSNLNKNDAAGKAIVYTISEDDVDGYTSEINGYNVKNTLLKGITPVLPQKTSVSGSKTWVDENNAKKTRPASITINLLANGKQVESKKVSAAEDWKYKFSNLNKNDAAGKAIVYTISEDDVEGYTSEINGYNVKNTLLKGITPVLPQKTSVSGSKTWVDENNAKKTRPASITINLLANGKQVESKKVSAAEDWKYKFSNLNKNDAAGKAIVYTISEDDVDGYTGEVEGYNVKNTLLKGITPVLPQKTSVSGSKTWVDENNAKKTRPASITINLLANGKQVESKKVSAAEDWKYKFSNLNKNDAAGKAIVYTISEDDVDGYTGEVEGYNVKNTLLKGITPVLPQKTSVSGSKTWVDENNAKKTRPASITINLLANGKQVESKKVSAAEDWKYKFSNLNKNDAAGKAIVYTISEDDVEGYTGEVEGYNVKNTLLKGITPVLPQKTSVSGSKTWVDENNAKKTRPASITINLLANGKQVESKKVSAAEDWKYKFSNLNKNDAAGKAIVYTISEDDVDGYTGEVEGYNVKNTLLKGITPVLPQKTSVSGSKTWVDENNAKKTRPASITINLLANGKQVESKKVSAAEDWKYKFSNLNKNDAAGKAIVYTISEDDVDGYTGEVEGYNVKNTLLKGITPVLPQIPNTPELPVIPDNNNPEDNKDTSNGNDKNDDIVENITKNVETLLPNTASQKLTVTGLISAVLTLLAGMIVWKKRK
ncbi:cell wall anchor domain-containing protein [Weissella koreensis KACC 15510]|uniref:Cna B-type domain-containing protein n=2 Tax=Weissella koreensis TaxID=165096 RepID=UPI0002175BE1|nr:Cna B-type domain-containing protein [Weissella koreensis]AEJ23616.1 cell wall anchor domain-containing protein [Weissella koreensis KACC 15510]